MSGELVNSLISLVKAKTYLKIGVFQGRTFFNVEIENKTAVDPNFRFNYKEKIKDKEFYFNMTSDDYFYEMPNLLKTTYKEQIKFDIIYLDGLHLFSQTYKDFLNTFKYTSQKTLWIFDDTIPSDPYSAIPNQSLCYEYRSAAGLKSTAWHGDIYKILFALNDFHKNFSYITLFDIGNPKTIVWKTEFFTPRKSFTQNIDQIENLNYFDLIENGYIVNPASEKEIPKFLFSNIEPNINRSKSLIKLLIKKIY